MKTPLFLAALLRKMVGCDKTNDSVGKFRQCVRTKISNGAINQLIGEREGMIGNGRSKKNPTLIALIEPV
jgi:hypothetical protein